MPKPRRPSLSRQQQAIRAGGKSEGRKVLYPIHKGPQELFMTCDAEEIFYGGAASGGKSYALRAWGVNYCLAYPGAHIILFRKSYRELEDTHIIAIQQEVPASISTYSAGSHNLLFDNGSIFSFRFCERDEEARSYDTAEFDAMLFDELTAFSQFQYTYLRHRCRSTKPWWPGRRIRSAGTPLGEGHAWVKAFFVDPAPPNTIWKTSRDEGSYTRIFIPAKVEDNYTMMKMHPEYVDTLRGLPYEERQAKLYGNWEIFSGQFFQRWRSNIHVIEPFDIPIDWDRWLSVDYGFNKPYCAIWAARPPSTNSIFFYREQYGVGIDSKEQSFRAWQVVDETKEKLRAVILDPSMFSKINVKGERVRPIADDWRTHFSRITKVIPGNNERIPGWRLMRQMLDWKEAPDGRMIVPPRMFFMTTCPNSIRTIPLMISDKHNIEDVDSDGEDHAPDAIRYLVRHAFEGSGRSDAAQRYYVTPQGIVRGRPKMYTPSGDNFFSGRM